VWFCGRLAIYRLPAQALLRGAVLPFHKDQLGNASGGVSHHTDQA
jgi:hypothetical protein